jgi:two-component system, sporulation sensor kinase E
LNLSANDSFHAKISMKDVERFVDAFIPTSLAVVIMHGKLVYANQNFLDETGYSTNELANTGLSDVIDFPGKLVALYESEKKFRVKVRGRNGVVSGHRASLLRLNQDNSLYAVTLTKDKEVGLPNLLQQFSGAFLQDVNLGVVLIDLDYNLVDISDMACRVLGLKREQILNKSMEEVFAGVPIQHQLVQRTILDGIVIRNHAVSWMNNQERHELLLDSNVLRDEQGHIAGAYLIFKDVSNLRSLEEQVQRSDRLAMIGQIAAGTAHEIRNPLTSIKGFLQVLKRTLENKGMEKERGYTEVMLTEIDRINELVNEFLLLSKPKNVSFEQTDLTAVLRGILPIINNEAILHKVHLQYEACYHMPKVIADQEMLKQVFLNICKNGIEALVDGGTLTITERLDTVDRYVSIDIHDTGPGIPTFVVDKIFDPFFTTKDHGTGLGLSVCQRIIHDIGGNIRVSSKGFGTTFTVSIPYP